MATNEPNKPDDIKTTPANEPPKDEKATPGNETLEVCGEITPPEKAAEDKAELVNEGKPASNHNDNIIPLDSIPKKQRIEQAAQDKKPPKTPEKPKEVNQTRRGRPPKSVILDKPEKSPSRKKSLNPKSLPNRNRAAVSAGSVLQNPPQKQSRNNPKPRPRRKTA